MTNTKKQKGPLSPKESNLFRIGQKKGYVTLDEIILNAPESQTEEQVDDLLSVLAEDGIDVVGIDSDNEQEVSAKKSRRSNQYKDSGKQADPVTIYMRQLKSVPLLTKGQEVSTAKRIEAAREMMLKAALHTAIAVEEAIALGRKVKAGKLTLNKVIEEDPLVAPENTKIKDSDTQQAQERFLATISKLQKLDREMRKTFEYLRKRGIAEEKRNQLRKKRDDIRQKMFEHLSQVDFQESYLEALVSRIKDIVARVEIAQEEIRQIEKEANASISQLRLLLRERRHPGFSISTAELPAISAEQLAIDANVRQISDEELAEYIRRLKNAERRIRMVERKANASVPNIIKAHRAIIKAEQKAQRGKDELVLANQRLVVHIASKYSNRGLPFLELVQEGNIGLMRAVEKFDYRRGYKFSTYGTWWIRHAISRAIANQTRTIRLPVHIRDAIRRIVKESQQYVLEVGREPTSEELAKRLEMDVSRVEEIMEASRKTLRWELPVGEDGETELGSLIADESVADPFENVSNKGDWEMIRTAMEDLRDREKGVLTSRFGLDGKPPLTLEEVGKELGITRERVRQIQARAVRKLQLAVRAARRLDSPS